MKVRYLLMGGALVTGLVAGRSGDLEAQTVDPATDQRIEYMDWNIRNLRPSGMPVIPIFDGWIPKEDGTADLCFGYMTLNLSETRDLPLGPDNFIEPAQYDGLQPTHFREVPPGYRRYMCVFTVNIPQDSGERVVWTLGHRGRSFSVPGHTGSPEYLLEDTYQPDRESIAPELRFLEPVQSEVAVGRAGPPVTAGPVQAQVGSPVALRLELGQPEIPGYEGDPATFRVYLHKYQGPGDVTFTAGDVTEVSPPNTRDNEEEVVFASGATVNLEEDESEAVATATFSEPGEYMLLVQGFDGTNGSFGMQCCWTTAYLRVNVSQ